MKKDKYFDIAFDSEKQCFVYCIYNEEGNLCQYFVLENKISLQVAKYQDIEVDLKQALKAIDELVKLDNSNKSSINETTKNALFDYVIILIVKCFNSSSGRKTSLNFKTIFKENQELLALYEKVLNIRNQQIAHSGDYMNSLVLYFDPLTNHPIDLRYSHIKRLTGEQIISYNKLNQLINYILQAVQAIKERLYTKLITELKGNGASHYYSSSKMIDKSSIVTCIEIDGQLKAKSFVEK